MIEYREAIYSQQITVPHQFHLVICSCNTQNLNSWCWYKWTVLLRNTLNFYEWMAWFQATAKTCEPANSMRVLNDNHVVDSETSCAWCVQCLCLPGCAPSARGIGGKMVSVHFPVSCRQYSRFGQLIVSGSSVYGTSYHKAITRMDILTAHTLYWALW